MTSVSLISTNDKIDLDSDKTNKNTHISINNSITPFKAFDSVLYMSEFLGNEENQTSEKSNKDKDNITNLSPNSYKKIIPEEALDLKVSPSLEKCLTSELLNSITNDSNNKKKLQILKFNNFNGNENLSNEKVNKLKITKKLFNHPDMTDEQNNYYSKLDNDKKRKQKIEKTLYEEIINGFEYQLKFIENSVHNILPKSYKKLSNNIEKNNPRINSLNYSDEYNNTNYNIDNSYKNENSDYSNNNYISYNNFTPCIDNKTNFSNINYNINNNGNANQVKHQIHKLKKADNYYGNWICNKCHSFNRGYRKTCVNCGYY